MKLLLGRSQKQAVFSLVPLRIGIGVMFNLHAELELDAEENVLIDKYRFSSAPLVQSNPIDDLKKAFRPAVLVGLVVGAFSLAFTSIPAAFALGGATTLVMTIIYFNVTRELILVSDLLQGGRTFRCDSIIELIEREAFLQGICSYLRQVLESAKHWDTNETVQIPPLDPAEAKQAVLKRLHG